jgi:hypothetical protein
MVRTQKLIPSTLSEQIGGQRAYRDKPTARRFGNRLKDLSRSQTQAELPLPNQKIGAFYVGVAVGVALHVCGASGGSKTRRPLR